MVPAKSEVVSLRVLFLVVDLLGLHREASVAATGVLRHPFDS